MTVPHRLRGAPMMALSSVFFAAMAVVVRAACGSLNSAQIVAGRFVIGILVCAGICLVRGEWPSMKRPWLWVQRGVLGGAAVYLYFFAIEHLAVGPATLLNYMSPIYAAVFGVVFLKEKAHLSLIFGLIVATVGGALVAISTADPSQHLHLNAGAWAGIFSAILSGAAMTTIRALRSDTDATSVFSSFSLFGLLFAAPFTVARWQPPGPGAIWALLAVGLLAAVAQMLMTFAYGYVSASAGSIWTEFTPVLSWLMGLLFLGEKPNGLATCGAALSIVGVLFGTGVVRFGRRLAPHPPTGILSAIPASASFQKADER